MEVMGRIAFIKDFIEKAPLDLAHATAVGPWKAFVIGQVKLALHERDLDGFVRGLQREPLLLGEDFVWFHKGSSRTQR